MPPSQAFTLEANGLADKIITDCWIRRAQGGPLPTGPGIASPDMIAGVERFSALWDTGASHTCVSSKVVALCGLQQAGTAEISARWGTNASECYLVDLWISENIAVRNALVARADVGHADVIIGMDVIRQGDLAISHVGGRTLFSFRAPSLGGLDFAAQQDLELHAAYAFDFMPADLQSAIVNGKSEHHRDPCHHGLWARVDLTRRALGFVARRQLTYVVSRVAQFSDRGTLLAGVSLA